MKVDSKQILLILAMAGLAGVMAIDRFAKESTPASFATGFFLGVTLVVLVWLLLKIFKQKIEEHKEQRQKEDE
jgi:uncharacterized membrane protein (DUF373 family)